MADADAGSDTWMYELQQGSVVKLLIPRAAAVDLGTSFYSRALQAAAAILDDQRAEKNCQNTSGGWR
jgi:hypothetical protein